MSEYTQGGCWKSKKIDENGNQEYFYMNCTHAKLMQRLLQQEKVLHYLLKKSVAVEQNYEELQVKLHHLTTSYETLVTSNKITLEKLSHLETKLLDYKNLEKQMDTLDNLTKQLAKKISGQQSTFTDIHSWFHVVKKGKKEINNKHSQLDDRMTRLQKQTDEQKLHLEQSYNSFSSPIPKDTINNDTSQPKEAINNHSCLPMESKLKETINNHSCLPMKSNPKETINNHSCLPMETNPKETINNHSCLPMESNPKETINNHSCLPMETNPKETINNHSCQPNESILEILFNLPPNFPVHSLYIEGNSVEVSRFISVDPDQQVAQFALNNKIKTFDCEKINGIEFSPKA
ncbi:hypothetical protein DS745_06815 [Anaerobacillus alkaliphilus]|uniref:Uncharacterized protein n=1 Tax=Anaerobacillus alkaliphilus TaxID=1548597 RepID=A0A4Q0VUJ3_9BACI|nr:hypothetical protein [Anaerobacillus alkaliphilus]RXJ02410.1 hypothetical protein DS745_06815 [Anaerobacillus alkaliphilus]